MMRTKTVLTNEESTLWSMLDTVSSFIVHLLVDVWKNEAAIVISIIQSSSHQNIQKWFLKEPRIV